MKWIDLQDEQQLSNILERSFEQPQVIFKHSTRCGISSSAKRRLEQSNAPEEISFYYLNIISYRGISNKIAEQFRVRHESPQILLIKNGECIYQESHGSIQMQRIASVVNGET